MQLSLGQGQRGREFAHVGSASALYLYRGWVCNKAGHLCKCSCSDVVAIRALPRQASVVCQQELTSRTSYTLRELDAWAPLKTDMTRFHFPIQLNWLPITNSCRRTKGTNILQSLWNSFLPCDPLFWTKSCLASQWWEISLQRAAILSTDRNQLTRTVLVSLAP